MSAGGDRAWPGGGTADRRGLTDAQWLALIRSIQAALTGADGSPRMVREHGIRGRLSASPALQTKRVEYGRVCSMSRQGHCWDNAPTESGFNRFKNARIFGERFAIRDAMTATAVESIEVLDNRKRLHSTLGDRSPAGFLKDWINTREEEQQVA